MYKLGIWKKDFIAAETSVAISAVAHGERGAISAGAWGRVVARYKSFQL